MGTVLDMIKRQRPWNPNVNHKFKAVRVEVDGLKFDSKLEARYYQELKIRVAAGEVSYFLRQVPIHLPGGVKYVVDFLVFFPDGSHEFVDTKGFETPEFKTKKKLVEALYPIQIKVVKR